MPVIPISVEALVGQSSKLRILLAKLHEIREKREKVIVFARLRTMQAILAKVLEAEFGIPVRIINGQTKLRAACSLNPLGQKTRNAILQTFRGRPGFNIIILSPFVAGIGLTIVEANHVVHYGRWWNPAIESQATDRAYRDRPNPGRCLSTCRSCATDPDGLIRVSTSVWTF